ncbi:helix-turn-helix domain-containing protein [Candidatus Enterococcus mansonii]|uniref:HTH cro/C1-type domain-containing protein n=1 Tax=Candidatus Enterococcus mansonii TaxID=1834181 RepID=A0A242C5Y9_9ENTE|nr:Rgg/GadR/MutR family transcriptional regulator [Enterococcus sp. 4G2_DIV0659]OTO05673.1 hypothetical protein A5880_002848 [Enterococcus sp. 4G2_DIV0659]
MFNYGNTYKSVRKAKCISQKQVCGNQISRTTLSKFENGHSDITLSNFIYLLEKLDLTFEEFLYLMDNNHGVDMTKGNILKKFIEIKSNLEQDKIEHLIMTCNEYLDQEYNWYIHSILEVLTVLQKMQQNPIDKIPCIDKIIVSRIWNYLETTDEWFILDIYLINSILFYFSTDSLIFIGNNLLKKTEKYNHFTNVNPLVISIYLNLIFLLMQNNRFDLALNFCNFIEKKVFDSKRYDFISVLNVRKGICIPEASRVELGLQTAYLFSDLLLQEDLQKEIDQFHR